ncbi:unnamed protein product [Caenorhabditis bovis]|uniref:Uncharacterized protein n=1 Tax=Caenorhabditis bovis TaxID=2654633 RepID=A0A8S1EJ12_9PELO|nr:unnamed protein product [Caenorhabditis bovis]
MFQLKLYSASVTALFKSLSDVPHVDPSHQTALLSSFNDLKVALDYRRSSDREEFVKEMARVLKAQSSDLQVWQRAHSEFFASIDSKEKFFTEPPDFYFEGQNQKRFKFLIGVNSTAKIGYNTRDEYHIYAEYVQTILGGYYSIYKIIHGGGCTETGIPDPSHITTNHSVTILSTPGSGPEFAKELVKNIPFPLASQQFQFYDDNFVKQGIFRGTVCDVEGAFIDHNQLREYMSRFWIRWRRNNENGTFQELVNTPDMYIFRFTIPLVFNNITAHWDYKIRCDYNLHGYFKWYVTLMELICPKELLARSLRNVYLTDIMYKTKEAIRELLLPTSNRWKSRFDFNDVYEKMKEGEPKIIVCDEKFVGVSKTMWHLYTNSTGNVTIDTSILFRGRPFRFRVTTDVYEEKHFRVNWDFDIAFDLLMASFFLEKLVISCPFFV